MVWVKRTVLKQATHRNESTICHQHCTIISGFLSVCFKIIGIFVRVAFCLGVSKSLAFLSKWLFVPVFQNH